MSERITKRKKNIKDLKERLKKATGADARSEITDELKKVKKLLKLSMPEELRREFLEQRRQRILNFYEKTSATPEFIGALEKLLKFQSLERLHVHTSHFTLCFFEDISCVAKIPRVEIRITPDYGSNRSTLELAYLFDRNEIIHALVDSSLVPNSALIVEVLGLEGAFSELVKNKGADTITINLRS